MRRFPDDDVSLPAILQRRQTDEFVLPPPTRADRVLDARVGERARESARRVGLPLRAYSADRRGTAAGLLALNEAFGDTFYRVPPEAARDDAAAEQALGGDEVVVDVQTHYVADRCEKLWHDMLLSTYRSLQPDWWTGMDDLEAHTLAEYLRCVFLETENAVAVLSSAPGLDDTRMLFNREMAGTREFLDRLGAQGRLLNHAVVHADIADDVAAMDEVRDRYGPVGWKVYTIGQARGEKGLAPGTHWWLDDEETGMRFLSRAQEVGVPLVCAHKGISAMVPAGSPRDVGPAARAFPDLDFVIYHSGWEFPFGDEPAEGPFSEETTGAGTNRLVESLRQAGIGPGGNVSGELGTTWFCLIRKPDQAAHVLGKLLLALGEDNLLWGTDSVWYGPTQPAIDAFRAFQIPESYRVRYGYPELTPALKAKVLGGNAARLYGIDLAEAGRRAREDDLAWLKSALDAYRDEGNPTLAARAGAET